ncbi:MAG: cell entry protein [Frankiales bacterium]|nr:cell entry protein [Frankiales bacterium]
MSDHLDYNRSIIAEFRANAGRTTGMLDDAPMVLLTTTGSKSGEPRTAPTLGMVDGDRVVVVASNAGAPKHPAWYVNMQADPEVTVEIGEQTFPARAVTLEGEERDRFYARITAAAPVFAEYRAKAAPREIPVVALERHHP